MERLTQLMAALLTLVQEYFPDKPEVIRKAIAADMAYAAQHDGQWDAPESRARLLTVMSAQLGEIQALQTKLREVTAERDKLAGQTRATLWRKLEHLAAVAVEAVGSTSAPVMDTQGVIRLRALLEGHVVINRVQALQERLDQAKETNRRSEAARMALHRRVTDMEDVLRHVDKVLSSRVVFQGSVEEYLQATVRVAADPDTVSELERDKAERLGVALGFLDAPVEIELD